jgi:hypothetical protein
MTTRSNTGEHHNRLAATSFHGRGGTWKRYGRTALPFLALAFVVACGGEEDLTAADSRSEALTVDQSILPAAFRTTWSPGIPGGIPADNDPVRPATVWLPSGNPYGGYSVNPALTGVGNAAAFT